MIENNFEVFQNELEDLRVRDPGKYEELLMAGELDDENPRISGSSENIS